MFNCSLHFKIPYLRNFVNFFFKSAIRSFFQKSWRFLAKNFNASFRNPDFHFLGGVNKVQQLNNHVHYKKQKYYYFLNSKTNILTFIKFEVTSSLAFKLSHSILLLSLPLCKTEKNVQTRKNQLFPIIIFPTQQK